MVRRMVEKTLCNVCLQRDDKEVDATFDEVVSVGKEKRRMTVCEPHERELMAGLALLEVYGEIEEEPPAPVLRYGCKFCQGTFPTPQARAKHFREDHRGRGELKAATRIEVNSVSR